MLSQKYMRENSTNHIYCGLMQFSHWDIGCPNVRNTHFALSLFLVYYLYEQHNDLVFSTNKTVMGSAFLGFWAGLDVFVFVDYYIVRKSIFDGMAKRNTFYCSSSFYSQPYFQSRFLPHSIRSAKQPSRIF